MRVGGYDILNSNKNCRDSTRNQGRSGKRKCTFFIAYSQEKQEAAAVAVALNSEIFARILFSRIALKDIITT